MPLDPRTARALLKLCREFSSDYDEIEITETSVKVSRGTAPTQLAQKAEPVQKRKAPVKRSAIESLALPPVPFTWEQ